MKRQLLGAILLSLSSLKGLSQTPPESNPGPIQAELLAHLSVRRLAPGDTVFAKVTMDWNGPGCALRTGAILEAIVEAADRRKTSGESKLALSFARAQCNGAEMQPMKLMLAAVAGPPQDWRVSPNPEFRVPMSFLQANGASPAGLGGSTISNFAMPTMELTGVYHHFPMGPKVKPGDVIDIRGMKLDIGSGPNQSSFLSAKNRDISLDAFTQFLLVPVSLVSGHAAASLIASAAPPNGNDPPPPMPPRASPPVAVNDLEACAPPGCAVDLPVTTKDLSNRDASSIPIQPLGYAPRPQKILGDFGNEEMLAWLGPRELLLAFNSHPLIHRSGSSQSGMPHRVIRAIL